MNPQKIFNTFLFFNCLNLFLFGKEYSRYYNRYHYSRDHSPTIIYILIILSILSASYFLYRYISKTIAYKTREFNNDIRIDNLLDNGIKIEINLLNSITQIWQKEVNDDNDLQSAVNVFIPFYWIKRNLFYQSKKFETCVRLAYEVNDQHFYKEIILPHSIETVTTYFQMQKYTSLYYDKDFPENCIVDLQFIN